MNKKETNRPLTLKQGLFCEYMFTKGSESIGNATKAYRAAYPDCKTDNSAAAAAVVLLRNYKIIAEKERIQAKQDEMIEHTLATSLKNLDIAYAVAKKQGNVSGMVAAEREKNAIMGLHTHTIVNKGDIAPVIDPALAAELDIVAQRYKLRKANAS